ncbi:uncharacterized protein LOC135475601 [Liolophura sinensis]|uniref:uncharacterized protein LOC135475601 n=1 Tax=Liolophura sinensis TaxID=3198878 RepID=UPI0031599389
MGTATTGIEPSIELWEALLSIAGFGIFASLLAYGFTFIRRIVHNDRGSLDTEFDAGGRVSAGLTATTIVSQWTWAATLLQSSTVASKYGISGPFWYAAGATIQILLFSMISVQLKIRAPGAKTFLQLIQARFGKRTHVVFCVFALMTNIIVTAMLMLGGAAVLTSLVKDLSVEYATILVTAVIGTYTFIGGLGATFYVSYVNTAVIYIIMIVFITKVYANEDVDNELGSIDKVYQYLACSVGPQENADNSYLTMISRSGLMFGLINIVGNFGTVFVDQSYWQSSVAAKPKQGVSGFLMGGLTWFAVPFSLATTMGLAYLALSAKQGAPLLSDNQVNSGLVPPIVAQRLLGKRGEIMIMFMILMAITSTGASEVLAVASILIYDIYQIHLKPYRRVNDSNSCILCGKQRGRMANPRDKCECWSMTYCADCRHDDQQIAENKRRALKMDYKCKLHGQYRKYVDYLSGLRQWCLMVTTLMIFPLTMVLNAIQLSLGWVYLFMGILIGSAVLPISLAMFWPRMTGVGMVTGSIGGTILAIIVWLVVASTFEGGLSDFLENTGREESMLGGNIVAIVSGGLLSFLVSMVTNRNFDSSRGAEVWESTRDIDNPLSPWTENYARDLRLTSLQQLDNRPALEEVEKTFRGAKLLAYIGAMSISLVLVIIWPAAMTAVGTMNLEQFNHWVQLAKVLAFIAMIFIIIVPIVNEIIDTRQIMAENKVAPKEFMSRGKSEEKDAVGDINGAKHPHELKNRSFSKSSINNGRVSLVSRVSIRNQPALENDEDLMEKTSTQMSDIRTAPSSSQVNLQSPEQKHVIADASDPQSNSL